MPAMLLFALAVTWTSALLAARYADGGRSESPLSRWHLEVGRELGELGWVPLKEGSGSAAARALAERQGLELRQAARPFSLGLYRARISGKPAASRALGRAATVLEEELARYPEQILARSRLRRVLLCSDLREDGQAIPSLPNTLQTLLLDVNARPAYLRRLVHHELFHFIDYADDDQLLRDARWEKLNDPYFLYGGGGRTMRDPDSSTLEEHRPGFLSRYSTSALEEDKAEVFSFLMTTPGAVQAIAARDPVVGAKVRSVKEQVRRLLPELNDHFWSQVETRAAPFNHGL